MFLLHTVGNAVTCVHFVLYAFTMQLGVYVLYLGIFRLFIIRNSSASTATAIWVERTKNRGSIPGRGTYFSLDRSVETAQAPTTSYRVDTEISLPEATAGGM